MILTTKAAATVAAAARKRRRRIKLIESPSPGPSPSPTARSSTRPCASPMSLPWCCCLATEEGEEGVKVEEKIFV